MGAAAGSGAPRLWAGETGGCVWGGSALGSGVSSTAKSWDVSRAVCVGSAGGRKTWWRQAGDGSEQPHVGPEVA